MAALLGNENVKADDDGGIEFRTNLKDVVAMVVDPDNECIIDPTLLTEAAAHESATCLLL